MIRAILAAVIIAGIAGAGLSDRAAALLLALPCAMIGGACP